MKHIYFLFICGSLFALEVDDLLSKIMQPKGIEKSKIISAKDPFLKPIIKREGNFTPPPEPVFTLKAIFEGTALINDKWHKAGDRLEGYEIFEIKKHSVVLFNRPKQKKVYLFEGKK
jgi:hypothetical protein